MNNQKSNNKMLKAKNNKGITLIALIITIIVLLILAVVAISAVQDDGIINYAKNARGDYEVAQREENATLQNYLDKLKENVPTGTGNETENDEKKDIITFKIGDTECKAERGMTWDVWEASSYAPANYLISTLKSVAWNVILVNPDLDDAIIYNGAYVNASKPIEAGTNYGVGHAYNYGNGNKITFTIDGKPYEGEEEMQWGAWIESDYNGLGENIGVLGERGSWVMYNRSFLYNENSDRIVAFDTIKDGGVYTS